MTNEAIGRPVEILLVEDNPGDARLIREMLKESATVRFELTHKERLGEALTCLTELPFDVLLLDIDLPDSQGLETVLQTISAVPRMPIIVLTGLDDDTLGMQAVEKGAQDYLVKGQINEHLLVRAILYASERHRLGEKLNRERSTLEQKVAERTKQLTKLNEQLKSLSSQLLTSQEAERKRIVQELHDSVGQTLSALKYTVEHNLNQMGEEAEKSYVKALKDLIPKIQNAVEEVDRIGRGLRPSLLDDLGILPTLSWFCREFQEVYSDIRIVKKFTLQENEVPEQLKVVIYRILQESLNNIAKHSRSDRVHISLGRKDCTLELSIRDNGRGFDVANALSPENHEGGLGLISMIKRAELSGGCLTIMSDKETGTTIQASWPC